MPTDNVLLRHGTRYVRADQDDEFLVTTATQLQDKNLLELEMDMLDKSINASDFYPPVSMTEDVSTLQRIQFYVFLHMWSISLMLRPAIPGISPSHVFCFEQVHFTMLVRHNM